MGLSMEISLKKEQKESHTALIKDVLCYYCPSQQGRFR